MGQHAKSSKSQILESFQVRDAQPEEYFKKISGKIELKYECLGRKKCFETYAWLDHQVHFS